MTYKDFLNSEEGKEIAEETKKIIKEEGKEAIEKIKDAKEVLIVLTERGCLCIGHEVPVLSALTNLFANLLEERTTEEDLIRCVRLAGVAKKGKLEDLSNALNEIRNIVGD